MTLNSLTNSIDSGVPIVPYPGLPTFRPSIKYEFSGEEAPANETPKSSPCAPGTTSATDSIDLLAPPFPVGGATGMRDVKSLVMVVAMALDPTSTVGARAVTTTSSALRLSGKRGASTRSVASVRSAIPVLSMILYPSFSK
jgi:hypothetical protein